MALFTNEGLGQKWWKKDEKIIFSKKNLDLWLIVRVSYTFYRTSYMPAKNSFYNLSY
jgi:hypothetical protein